MKNIFAKYLLIGLVLIALVLPSACAKPTSAKFEVSSLVITPTKTVSAEPATISVDVNNTGESEGTHPLTLTLNGVKVETKVVKVAPESTEKASFIVVKEEPGIYSVEINGLSGTLQVLRPAEFAVSNLVITPTIAEAGQTVAISVDIRNSGEVEGSYAVTLKIDGSQVETKEVAVAPSVSQTVSFTFTKDAAGRYSIDVAGLSGLLKVRLLTDTLKQLKVAYPELVQELLKLPDLEEIEAKDDEAIEDITHLALAPECETAFESMLNEGIKDKRKYCTPLEALLWVAYDREFNVYNPLKDYSLEKLVNEAWENTTTSKNYASERWQSFDEVVDRLSSPILVSIYMLHNIAYDYEEAQAQPHRFAPPEDTFARKKGICNEMARFALHCLLANDYDYDNFEVSEDAACTLGTDIDMMGGHDVCLYKDKGVFYIINNGRIQGPFASVEKAADATAACTIYKVWNKYFFRNTYLTITKIVRR